MKGVNAQASFRSSFGSVLPPSLTPFTIMSQHKSLQGVSGLVVKRNVLKRFERVEILRKRNQWKTGDRVVGLRKTKPDV